MKVKVLLISTVLFSLLVQACSSPAQAQTGKIVVVSTVAPITNIIYNIGGDRIQLTGLIPEGSDSHTYEPRPSDAKILSQADLIILNGLMLEQPTLKLAEATKKPGAEIIKLGEETITPSQYVFDFSFPKENGSPNPHLWINPIYALNYAQIVRDALSKRDPADAGTFDQNFQAYRARLKALDTAIMATIETIPAGNRKLLTYHDSFAYFAPRYGMTVVGAIQPASFAEPSAREVADLISQIRKEKVPAIFGSEVFPSPVLAQIAKESGAQYVDKLRDDELPGKPGDRNHSYIGLMVEDVTTMAKYLGGDPSSLSSIDPSNIPGSSGG